MKRVLIALLLCTAIPYYLGSYIKTTLIILNKELVVLNQIKLLLFLLASEYKEEDIDLEDIEELRDFLRDEIMLDSK